MIFIEIRSLIIRYFLNSSQYSAARRVCGITIVPPTILATAKISYIWAVVIPNSWHLPKMILDTIITTKHHAGNQTKHFFRLCIQCTILVSIGVKIPKTFHHKIVFTKDHLVHPGAVIIKFFY